MVSPDIPVRMRVLVLLIFPEIMRLVRPSAKALKEHRRVVLRHRLRLYLLPDHLQAAEYLAA